jgi:DNA-binding HxlR family transcriptional regulator
MLRLILQGKWRLAVIRELIAEPIRLSELRRRIPSCSKKVLIETLHFFEGLGWIERIEFDERVRHVEYSLKPEHAEAFRRVDDRLNGVL